MTQDAPPVSARDLGIYVHFPYCERKCPYCDFNSHVVPHDDRRYANAVIRELRTRSPAYRFDRDHGRLGALRSIYFGGGTPSLWDPIEVGRVLRAIEDLFPTRSPNIEVTLEANPGTIDEGHFDRYREVGITRFSIGSQSFADEELVTLGRIHDASASARAVKRALATGACVSLDLIYGLPGQGRDAVRRSVERALSLGPSHISAYTLTIEPDTVLDRRERAGLFAPMPGDLQAELIEDVSSMLESAGFTRYEISSYAPPGREAVHNTLYWFGGPYLGVGAGAHSFLPDRSLRSARRCENIKNPSDYLEDVERGTFSVRFEERLDQKSLLADRLWTAMRTRWGLDLTELTRETDGDLPDLIQWLSPTVHQLEEEGLVVRRGGRIIPTQRGFLLNDRIARALVRWSDALVPSP